MFCRGLSGVLRSPIPTFRVERRGGRVQRAQWERDWLQEVEEAGEDAAEWPAAA